MQRLTFQDLQGMVAGRAAALRCVTDYQPAGGPGDKVFPPTYEGAKYAGETRIVEGEKVDCILLDSVASQANRIELALLEAHRAGRLKLPTLSVAFESQKLRKPLVVTSWEAPHRAADAIFRDSLLEGTPFRDSELGSLLNDADIHHATGLYQMCPAALVFGIWDSTGPRGGLGAKFQRTLVSEFVALNAVAGTKTSSRVDPLQIEKRAGPAFRRPDGSWTAFQEQALQKNGKAILAKLNNKGEVVPYDDKKMQEEGRPSVLNHGNVTPSITEGAGGITMSKARQTTVLSLPALRRLRFPLAGERTSKPAVDLAARTALAALALCGAVLAREEGADLRSRCHLVPEGSFVWEVLDHGQEGVRYELTGDDGIDLVHAAVQGAERVGLSWYGEIDLVPTADLMELLERSQALIEADGAE